MSTDLSKPPGPLALHRDPLPAELREVFLAAAARTGRPLQALENLGYAPTVLNLTIKADPAFGEALEAAKARNLERLEAVADDRAIEGWEEPVYQLGKLVGYITKYDHTLLMRRIEAEGRRKYGKHVEVDAKVAAGVLVVPSPASDSASWAAAFGAVGAAVASTAIDVTDAAND